MRYIKKPVPVIADNVRFDLGITYIISREKLSRTHKIDVLVDADITLRDISTKYPHVIKVIHEGERRGVVYNYGNHTLEGDKAWEMVGGTVAYL